MAATRRNFPAPRNYIPAVRRAGTEMRITFVNGLYPPHGAGGAETTLRWLASQLAARGHTCSVITLSPDRGASAGVIDGIPVRYLPLTNVYWPHAAHRPPLKRPLFQALDAYNPVMGQRVRRALAELKPDVVHSHNLQGFSAAAWTAAAGLDVPIVQTIHDYYLACPRSAMWRPRRGNCSSPCVECRLFSIPRRMLTRLPAIVTAVSHRVFDRLVAAGAFPAAARGHQPVRIIRGNNAGPMDGGKPQPGRGLRLGFFGRLDPLKGVDNLLDALAELPPQAITLRVGGGGAPDYVAALQRRAAALPNVTFIGHVDPAAFFPTIDLLVIPSVWEDPFPRVFHEALAYGVPSLVAPAGGLPEVVQPGRNGFVALGTDVPALRASLAALIANGWDREAMRLACRAAAAAYAPDRIVGQYEAVLTAAANRTPLPEGCGEVWRAPARPLPSTPGQEAVSHGT
jgi:glycosyltransferase involved in cell wall biosynthesis